MGPWFSSADHILAVIAIVFGLAGIIFEIRLHKRFEKQSRVIDQKFETQRQEIDQRFESQKSEIDQKFDTQKLEIDQKFDAQKEKIEQIVLSVHTSYIGKFPQDLEKTTELIANAKADDEIWILADFLGYGHYSAPLPYEKYVKTLRESQAKIRILIYDEESAKSALQVQFKREEHDSIKNSETFRKYVEYYQNKKVLKKAISTYEDFLNALVTTQDHFCLELTREKHIDVRAISSASVHEAVFYWIVCKKEMIFAFPNSYTGRKEFSFKTRDDHLIEIFADQFANKWPSGKPVQDNCYPSTQLFAQVEPRQDQISRSQTLVAT